MFTYELARKLTDSGVKVNAVCPGIVQLIMLTGISTSAFYNTISTNSTERNYLTA